MCLNAGAQLGTSALLEDFVAQLGRTIPRWSFCFLSELDNCSKHDYNFHVAGAKVYVHKPCAGKAIAWLVRDKFVCAVKDLVWLDRVGAIHIKSAHLPSKLAAILIGIHGSHDFIEQTFSDVAQLAAVACNHTPVAVLGDTNVDLLPVSPADPCSHVHGRHKHHMYRRLQLYNLCDSLKLSIVEPLFVESHLCEFVCQIVGDSLATRIPIGEQDGCVSQLDYAFASENILFDGRIHWDLAQLDHAAVSYCFKLPLYEFKRHGKRRWHCTDVNGFIDHLATLDWDEYDVSEMLSCLRQIQNSFQDNAPCKRRSYDRMPFVLRNAYAMKAHATNRADWHMWSVRCRLLRKQWVHDLQTKKQIALALAGKASFKAKKLFPIKGLSFSGQTIIDGDSCADKIAAHYTAKWGNSTPEVRMRLLETAIKHDGVEPDFTEDDISDALKILRNKSFIDCEGMCVLALQYAFVANSFKFTEWLNRLASRTPCMSKLQCMARPTGKASSTPTCDDVRLLLPQSSVMGVLDVLLSTYLAKFLDGFFPLCRFPGAYIGAKRYTQPLEITHCIQVFLEKAIDSNSQGCVAQSDIQKYYDTLPIWRIMQWFLSKLAHKGKLFAALRHQAFTSISVAVPFTNSRPRIRNRCIGGLTGSRTAGVFARLPVEDAVSTHAQSWLDRGLGFQKLVSIGTWVDNAFALSDSVNGATMLLDELESYLRSEWALTVKPSSREFMPVWGADDADSQVDGWKHVKVFKALGHLLEHNGSVESCFKSTVNSAWRSFWGNVGKPVFKKFGMSIRLARIKRLVFPVVSYRFVRWPFSRTRAARLDKIQTEMTAIVLGIRKLEGETPQAYAHRRNKEVRSAIPFLDRWSTVWAQRILSWYQHVDRNTMSACWVSNIWHVKTPEDLEKRRRDNSSRRPSVRCVPGWGALRWTESISSAENHIEMQRNA